MLATVSKPAWTDLELAPHTCTSSVRVTLFCQVIVPAHYVSSDSLSSLAIMVLIALNRFSIQLACERHHRDRCLE
jgi:hypothetical protein